MKITIKHVADAKYLHHHYQGQSSAQDLFIELDCAAQILRADWNGEIGNAIPLNVYHGHDQRWRIPLLRTDTINALLDQIAPLAERVCDGYALRWDGNNDTACFLEDATAALAEIEEICNGLYADESNSLAEWAVDEWINPVYHDETGQQCKRDNLHTATVGDDEITAATTDAELQDIADNIEAVADSSNVVFTDDVCDWLTEMRDQCQKNTTTVNN